MNDLADKSFWLEEAGPYNPAPPLQGDLTVDVAIVGGGFTGLSTALHIKERQPGLRVAVLEAGAVGWGASGRNAGFSMTLFGISLGLTIMRWGEQRAREADEYMVRAVEYTENQIDRLGIDCNYERTGLLQVAANRGQLKLQQHEFKLASKAGLHETRWLDRDETQALVGSPLYVGARFDPLCALLQPARLVRGLAKAAKAAGVTIYEGTPVTAVHPGPNVRLDTPGGCVTAGKVVLATNAYAAWHKRLRRLQVPMHTYIVLTEPLSDLQLEAIGWRQRVGIEDGRNLLHYYRLTPDNRILMGGHDAIYYYGNRTGVDRHRRLQRALQRTVRETFPALGDVTFTHHWGGPISATLDLVPAIGHIGPNIVYSLGCMGHGVALTQLNGRTVADLVLETPSELTSAWFVERKALPIPPEPLRYPVIQSIRGMLRLLDGWDELTSGSPRATAKSSPSRS